MSLTSDTTLDSYADRIDAQIDPENLLGRLFWYLFSGDLRVTHKEFVTILSDAGITTGLPLAPKDVDVFKRVCSEVKRVKQTTADPDIFENFRMVEFRDDNTVRRRVVRERVNNNGRKLGFTELFDIIFDRETSDIVMKPINGFKFRDGTVAASIRDEVFDNYYDWRGCLTAYAIREWMRAYIMRLGATSTKPGAGIYFLRERHQPIIEALETMGLILADFGGKVEFHSLPLIDDRKQREMVQRAFEAETIDAIDKLIDEITKLSRKDGKITSDRYAGLVDQYQELTAKTHDYEDLLSQKLASTGTRLDIFQRSLLGLRSKVKSDA